MLTLPVGGSDSCFTSDHEFTPGARSEVKQSLGLPDKSGIIERVLGIDLTPGNSPSNSLAARVDAHLFDILKRENPSDEEMQHIFHLAPDGGDTQMEIVLRLLLKADRRILRSSAV